jgi:DNA-binding NarL/FixJ family response regulator
MTSKDALEKVTQIDRNERTKFRAAIVDRDAMGSGLLADALIRVLKCEAVRTRPPELLRVLGVGGFDLAVISGDLNLKSNAGFELVEAVSRAHPKLPIIMLLNQTTREAVINAFRSGARGVFNRQEDIARFLDCVDHVRTGAIWAEGVETDFLLEALKSIPAPSALAEGSLATLTVRELQVVNSAAKGKTNKAIAAELLLSEHTVKNYLFRAFEKLGVSNRIELLFFLTVRGMPSGKIAEPRGDSVTPISFGPTSQPRIEASFAD